MSHLENPSVEKDHDKAGNVERSERRVDDEVRIVERANELLRTRRRRRRRRRVPSRQIVFRRVPS